MITDILVSILHIFYVPKSHRTCENGCHRWAKWGRAGLYFQYRNCMDCGITQERKV